MSVRFIDPYGKEAKFFYPVEAQRYLTLMQWRASGTTRKSLEEIVVERGFADVDEFQRMIASIPMSKPGAFVRFKGWQYNDGTKQGLETLIARLRTTECRIIVKKQTGGTSGSKVA